MTDLAAVDPGLADALAGTTPDVLTILRGGLNFDLPGVVEQVTGRPCRVSFLSSRRAIRAGDAVVTSDEYRRIDLAGSSVLFIGDITATGRTVTNALTVLADVVGPEALPPRIVLVTIGTMRAVERIDQFVRRLGQANRSVPEVTVIALEGLFGIYEQTYGLALHLDQTDFVRRGGLITPEFTTASRLDPVSGLERCVIYDGGLRGFSPGEHLGELREYWTRLVAAFSARPALVDLHRRVKTDQEGDMASRLDRSELLDRCYAHRDHIVRAHRRTTGS
ncbi:hypothetical protein ABT336_20015 [Micromonospora sp. NPDC000207]|uniref:hypothetical protein n=1 Tax=Micromonospora sp. NPDC000207 TaxID=3154246 RepID=UPI003323D355